MSNPAQNLPHGVVGLTLSPGDRVQHYTVAQLIGSGGTSAVFKAHDALLNRHVAIKQVLLAPGEEADAYRARALAEADAHKKAAAANPSMLVQLFDVIADARGVLLITEFVDGPSLEQILQANPAPMDERQALGILAGAAKGLSSLHTAGILHRDIKPGNILMPRSGGLRLTDFGLSVAAASGTVMDQGTVRYMAPEVLQDQPATPASDLYALGMVAYEMLAGRAQFDEAFKAILRDQRNQAMRWLKWHTNARIKAPPLAQLNPAISPATAELVERLMDKDPVRRIRLADDLLGAIRTIAAGPAASSVGMPAAWASSQGAAPGAQPAAPTARVPQRRRWPLVAAAAGVAVLLAAVAIQQATHRETPDPASIERARILDLMNAGEDAWKAGDFSRALETFQSLQAGGKDARLPGTLSRRFADAGAAKCQAELAFARKDYAGALAAAQSFRDLADELEKSPAFRPLAGVADLNGKYPAGTLHTAPVEQSELAARMLKPGERFRTRKDVADAVARMRELLDAGKTKDCTGLCNEWLARSGVLDDERAAIRKILAECGMNRNERRLARLLDEAQTTANGGDILGATRLLDDELKLQGDNADPRVRALLDAILGKARRDQLAAKYQAATGLEEKINLLATLVSLDPAFPDKAKLPSLRADLLWAQATAALNAGDALDAGRKATQGLELDPKHAGLLALCASLAKQSALAQLALDAGALYEKKLFTQAAAAYDSLAAQAHSEQARNEAKARAADCRGQLALEKAEILIKAGELDSAKTAFADAKQLLPDDPRIDAGLERIAHLRQALELREAAEAAFNRGDLAGAVSPYAKLTTFLKDHPGAGNLEAAEERLRQCRFEASLRKLQEAMARHEWASARGSAAVAKSYVATPDEKKRLDADCVKLEQLIQLYP